MELYASSTAAQNHPMIVISVLARTNNISNVTLINSQKRLPPNQSKHTIHLVKTDRPLYAGINYLLVGSSLTLHSSCANDRFNSDQAVFSDIQYNSEIKQTVTQTKIKLNQNQVHRMMLRPIVGGN